MADLHLTVLIENTAPEGLTKEHGLSIYLEYRGRRYLLDGGSSGVFTENASKLGIDLSAVKMAFLSHGHYDHADGLGAFLALNSEAPVYARPGVLEPDYHGERYIGVNPSLFHNNRERFRFEDGPLSPDDGIWLIPDQTAHEQSLVLETEEGLVILNSCCHAGADQVVESVQNAFSGQKVCALIGGFHLMGDGGPKTMGPAPEEILYLGTRLFSILDVGQVWTGHCTGIPGFALLEGAFPGRVNRLTTGLRLEF